LDAILQEGKKHVLSAPLGLGIGLGQLGFVHTPVTVSFKPVIFLNIHWTRFGPLQLNCCGATGPLDYQYSVWFNHTKNSEGVFVPPSCCVLLNDDPHDIVIKDANRCQLDAILYPISLSYSLKSQVRRQVRARTCTGSLLPGHPRRWWPICAGARMIRDPLEP